jgi:hypothetical protein
MKQKKKEGGELRLNERFEMKRDGNFFIKKTQKKSTRKYIIIPATNEIHK